MKKQTKTQEIFIAEDGTEFLVEKDCENYEKNILSREKKISYFSYCFGPDTTEGRGFNNVGYIAVEGDFGTYMNLEFAIYYLFKTHGTFSKVMGVQPIPNWSMPKEITKGQYMECRGMSKYDKPVPVFLSNYGPFPELPNPITKYKEKES